jgi:hypothetical protein
MIPRIITITIIMGATITTTLMTITTLKPGIQDSRK